MLWYINFTDVSQNVVYADKKKVCDGLWCLLCPASRTVLHQLHLAVDVSWCFSSLAS